MRRMIGRTIFHLSFALTGLSAQPLAPQYIMSTFAGSNPAAEGVPATTAFLLLPRGIARDSANNIYIADYGNNRILKVDSTGLVSTFAGTGVNGPPTGDGGLAIDAQIGTPTGLAADAAGNLYVSTSLRIRRITPDGSISTFAGGGAGSAGDGGPATAATFKSDGHMAFDRNGNLYVADLDRVRKIGSDGTISTVAGTGTAGFSGDGGPATAAQVYAGRGGIAFDPSGNFYFADSATSRIRKVTPDGIISTFVGNGNFGSNGDGGQATSASLASPGGLAFDNEGNLLIADTSNNKIRKVNPAGIISSLAGTGATGFAGDGGLATEAQLRFPMDLIVGAAGTIYVADWGNNRVRAISPLGIITTLAGRDHFFGDGAPATEAVLWAPSGVVAGDAGTVYLSDTGNHRIRKISPDGVVTTVAGTGNPGFSGDGGQATDAKLNNPRGLALDLDGNLYIADASNYRIRKVTPGGVITTVVGNGKSGSGRDGDAAIDSPLLNTFAVAVDGIGNLYLPDGSNHRIRKVNAAGRISTVAGDGTRGFSGDGALAVSAQLNSPNGVAVDGAGNLYIADIGNSRVRMVATSGIIRTVAGGGSASGEGVPAIGASVLVGAVAVDRDGNLYIAGGNRIRLVTPSGIITTIAGSFDFGSGGDGGLATLATLGLPTAVTADASGNVYIADTNNHRIRKATLNVPAQLDLVSGNNQTGAAGTTLPDPLVVQLTGTAGAPVFGVPVVYAVTSGDATLSATNTNTSLDGTAGIAVTLGAMLGTITVSASVANLPAAVFTLTAVEKAGTGQQPGNASGGSRTRSRAISYLLECQLCLIP